jgi:catechol 2,3-dioxygenase
MIALATNSPEPRLGVPAPASTTTKAPPMSTPSSLLSSPPVTPPDLREDRVSYGAVHLDVVELGRSLGFWRDLIGLRELGGTPDGAVRLGVGGQALVVLHPGAQHPVARGHAGLYHLAIHLPDATEFARIITRLAQARVRQSPTDHIFSQATYLNDPDGILLELTLETPERFGSISIGADSVVLTDSDGRQRGGTEPLDLAAALAPLAGGDPLLPLPSGSSIGHVHLHVPDLAAAYGFYRDVIGFAEHAYMTPIGMADLSAGGRFPHRLAINNWHGPSARQPTPGTAGLRGYELVLHDPGALAQLAQSARVTPSQAGVVSLRDPAGNQLSVTEARPARSTR